LSTIDDAPPGGRFRPADGLEIVTEWDADLATADPLGFPGYLAPVEESIRTGLTWVGGRPAAVVWCHFARVGGTMGAVGGERIVRAFRRATDERLPVVEIVSSGGARLQEGMVALIQMARTSTAVARHRAAGLLSVAALHSPTTGGVYASWASLTDLRAAEPGATIGFAGPRVVAEMVGEYPPAGSHTAESAYAAGLVDALVPAPDTTAWLESALGVRRSPLLLPPGRPAVPQATWPGAPMPADPFAVLARARHRDRPSGLEWAAWLTDSWVELRGPDPAIRAGLADLGPSRVIVIAMDRHARGDGAARPGPGAFRLARRAIGLATRLRLPVVTLVDTPGAEPGPRAEADGIAHEIAETIQAMAACPTPTVGISVGVGGSGGAMALAHTDRLLTLSGAVFAVIGPEAGAAILFRDAGRAPELTRRFKLTAEHLAQMGVVDEVVDELAEDAGARLRAAVLGALHTAVPGDRDRRIDAVTQRALAP
jgi:acetyl-CoA carboxylase carboxyl transferase subunit beta